MQSTMNPISPVGRAVLPTMQGATPDQATARATEIAKTGLIPFDQAISMKQMADIISKSGGMMNQGLPETVVGSLRRQIQEAMNPPAAPPAMNAGVASLPMPDDMYAGVGMAGGGIVAFSNGGPLGPYQSPSRIPYEESLFGRLQQESLERERARLAEEARVRELTGNIVGESLDEFRKREAERIAPQSAASMRRQAELFGGELPPLGPLGGAPFANPPLQSSLTGSANMLAAAGYKAPTISDLISPQRALGAAPDLRPGDKAPPPALRGAPPVPTGPAAPTGIAALIPRPDLKAIQKEVDKSYRGLKDVYTQREASLTQREDELGKLLDTSQSESLMDFGIRLMEAAKPGVEFVEAVGTAGRGYREARKERQKELFEAQNRLKDAQFEVNAARAQFDVNTSDKVYERLNKATEVYLDEQKRVQELQQAERDRQDKLAIYGTEIEKARLARGISDIDERLFGMAKDDPLRPSLQAQRESLMGTLNTLTGDSYTNDIRQQQLIVQATDDIKKTPEYEAAALSASSAYNSLASLDPEDDEEEYNKAMDRYTAAKTRMDEILKTGLSQLGLSPLGGSVKPEELRSMVGD